MSQGVSYFLCIPDIPCIILSAHLHPVRLVIDFWKERMQSMGIKNSVGHFLKILL